MKEAIQKQVEAAPELLHLVLNEAAINHIDNSGAHALVKIASELKVAGIGFHLAEVKEPVLNYFKLYKFNADFAGQIYLSLNEAVSKLIEKQQALSCISFQGFF